MFSENFRPTADVCEDALGCVAAGAALDYSIRDVTERIIDRSAAVN